LKNSVLRANFENVFIFPERLSHGGHFDTKNFKIEAIIFFSTLLNLELTIAVELIYVQFLAYIQVKFLIILILVGISIVLFAATN
jgi:hypothetical protein